MNTESPPVKTVESPALPSTIRYPRWVKLGLAFVAVALLLSQCVSIGFPTEGVVVDSETNQPLPNVWVNQEWSGDTYCVPIPAPHGFCNSAGCIAVAMTHANERGQFRFARPDGFKGGSLAYTSVELTFWAFKVGYEVDPKQQYKMRTAGMHRWQDRDITIVMRKQRGTRIENLAMTADSLSRATCKQGALNYAMFLESMFEQMRAMEVTHEEWAQGIAYTWGDMSLHPTPQMLVERRAQAALKAPSVIKENYAPYARYVDYLKKREKP